SSAWTKPARRTGGCGRRGTNARYGPACWTSNACCGSTAAKSKHFWLPGWKKGGKRRMRERSRWRCKRRTSLWWAKDATTGAVSQRELPRRRREYVMYVWSDNITDFGETTD